MKTVESSAVFQPKQWAEKASREDNRKQEPNPNLCPRTLFEVPLCRSSVQGHRSEIMFGVLVVVFCRDCVAALGFSLAFSSSSCFTLRISVGSNPSYFFFQLK